MIYMIGFFIFSLTTAVIFIKAKVLEVFLKLIGSYKESFILLSKERENISDIDVAIMRLVSMQFKLIGIALFKIFVSFLPLFSYVLVLHLSGNEIGRAHV